MQSKLRKVNVLVKSNRQKILKCLVCGEQCFHRNYGTLSATFFRRSIKQNRLNYVCKRNEECQTEHGEFERPLDQFINTFSGFKRICMHCRFQKCIAIGINIDFVLARHQPQVFSFSSEDGLYVDVVNQFNYAFTQRTHGQKSLVGSINCTETSLWHQFYMPNIERPIVKDYLQQTGILSILNEDDFSPFIDRLLPFWFFIYCTFYTLRNNGQYQNELYMIDERGIYVAPAASRRFIDCVPIPGLQNVDVVSAKIYDVHVSWMNGVKNFHENQMQLPDFAIICHILVLRLAIEMFPHKPEPREHLNCFFRTIRQSFDGSYDNAEIRMGNMLLLINDVMSAVKEMHEWEIIFRLSMIPRNKEQLPYYNQSGGAVDYFKRILDA
ncbi:Nuclear receptor subfamily 2 group B member 4 [Aphelenchoides besseyi]|nr:Nuclear receptor subfamily 2 group B member 4 [Aphelenchoides besseyi]